MPGNYQFALPERPSRDGWFRVGTLDITTTAAMVALGIASMVVYAIDGASGAFLKLPYYAPFVRDGELWRLVTWPIANPPDRIWVLLTLAFFWFIGHRVEDRVGRVRFTLMLVLMTVLPAAAVALFDFSASTGIAYGLGILAISLLAIYAFDSPGAVWFFNIPLWIVASVFVLLDVLQQLGNRYYGALLVELGAIVVGSIVARQYGMLNDLSFIPRFGGRSGTRSRPAKSRRSPRGGGQTVVAGPWSGSNDSDPRDQYELDALLDKISANGIDSLGRAEKARLNELSKKLRGR